MKRSSFKKPTYEEAIEKLANKKPRTPLKRSTFASKALKPKKAIKPKKKVKTQAQLKKELDKYFSLYIRKVHPAKCYTCGKTNTSLQCGHFISRAYLATRFHENNCRPQCVGCNIFGNGKPLDFEENLKKELGELYVEKMKKLRHRVLKVDRKWYLEQIERYKELLTPLT
jgi:hypothetical protein